MQKFYVYGRLFACLDVIQANGWLPAPDSESIINNRFDQTRLSFLLRNHRKKLNCMDSRTSKILEQELLTVFRMLPVEPFPNIRSFYDQRELINGYYDQMSRLNKEIVAVS